MDLSNTFASEQGRRRSSRRHSELPLISTTTAPAIPCASAVLARPTNSTFSHDQLAMFHQQAFSFHNPNPDHHHPLQRQPQPQLQPELPEDPALLIPSTTSGRNYANPHLSPTAARLELYGLHPYGAFSQPTSPHVPSYQNSPAPSSSAEFTWTTPVKCPTTATVLTPATGYSIPTHVGEIESIQLPGPHWQQHPHFPGPASAANASPVPQLLVFPEPENSSASSIAAPVHDFRHLQQHSPADTAAAAKMGSRKSSLGQQPVFMVNESLDQEVGFNSNPDHDIDFSNFDLEDLDLDTEQPQPSSPLSAPSPHPTTSAPSVTLSAPSTPHTGGPRAPKYTSQEWEAQRAHIRQLYLDEDRTLRELIRIMGERHRFHATPRMYNARFRMWNFSKYKKPGRAPSVAGARRRRASSATAGPSRSTGRRRSSGPPAAAAINSGSGIGNIPSAPSAIGAGAARLNLHIPRTVPAGTVQGAMPVNPNISMMNMLSPTTTTGPPLMTSPATLTPDVQFGGDFNLFP